MAYLVFGLIIFLGIHSIRLGGDSARTRLVGKFGENGYKAVYTVLSFIGVILMIYGYGQTRIHAVDIWYPDGSMRGVTILLALVAFIFFAANEPARDKPSHIKRIFRHPMTVGVIVWSVAHLLVNGRLGDIVFFGSFLVWAILIFLNGIRRDRVDGAKGVVTPAASGWRRDIASVIGGVVVWALFAFVLHPWLIGIRVMG